MRNDESSYKVKSKNGNPPSNKGGNFASLPNKFSYNFQPANMNVYQNPPSKSNNRSLGVGLGLGYLPLPKAQNNLGGLGGLKNNNLLGANHYKF